MLSATKCEAPPAQPENRAKSPKINLRWWRLTFFSGQHQKLSTFNDQFCPIFKWAFLSPKKLQKAQSCFH